MFEVEFHLPDGGRDYFFHASLQSARAHVRQFRGWVKARIIYPTT